MCVCVSLSVFEPYVNSGVSLNVHLLVCVMMDPVSSPLLTAPF